ncbi:MAG: hypothetical protein U0163_12115 [Gemmatimonadaceae bacterium]
MSQSRLPRERMDDGFECSPAQGAGRVHDAVPGASLLVGGVVAGVWSVGVAMTAGLAAAQRRRTERAQLALEQILDRLERGEISLPNRGGQALLDLLSPLRR